MTTKHRSPDRPSPPCHPGDDGFSGTAYGPRLSKTHPLFDALGALDELNCALGMARSLLPMAEQGGALISQQVSWFLVELLVSLQHAVFRISGQLAQGPSAHLLPQASAADLGEVEQIAAQLTAHLPPVRDFVLPGGCPISAALHQARAIARRAERHVCRLRDQADFPDEAVCCLVNRLSDLLFAMACLVDSLVPGRLATWRRDAGWPQLPDPD